MLYQQGDVLIERRDIPADAQPRPGRTLAEGEATGHSHVIEGSEAQLLAEGDRLFVRILGGDCRVVHEEHKPIEIPPGEYEVRRVQEYDHLAEEARQVRD